MENTIATVDMILNDQIRQALQRAGRWEIDDQDVEHEKRNILRTLVQVHFVTRGF